MTLENMCFSCAATVSGSGWCNMDREPSKLSLLQLLLLAVTSTSPSVGLNLLLYTFAYSKQQRSVAVSLTGACLPFCLGTTRTGV